MNRQSAALMMIAALLAPSAEAAVRVVPKTAAPAAGTAGLRLGMPVLPRAFSPDAGVFNASLPGAVLPAVAFPEDSAALPIAAPQAAAQAPSVQADLTRLGRDVGAATAQEGIKGAAGVWASLDRFWTGETRRRSAAPVEAPVRTAARQSGLRPRALAPNLPVQQELPFPPRRGDYAESVSAVTDYEPGIPGGLIEEYRRLYADYDNISSGLQEYIAHAMEYPTEDDADTRMVDHMLKSLKEAQARLDKLERRHPGIHYHARSRFKKALGLGSIALQTPKPILLATTRARWSEGVGATNRRNDFAGTIVSVHKTPFSRRTMAVVVLDGGGMREVRIAPARVLNPAAGVDVTWPAQTYVPGNDRDPMSGRFIFGSQKRGHIVSSRRHLTDEFYEITVRGPGGSLRTMGPQLYMRLTGTPGESDGH